jgi:hypothetical protein
MKLRGLADSVVVAVDPNEEFVEDRIPGVDHAIAVPSVCRIVKDSQRSIPVGISGGRLRSQVSKQFAGVVNLAVPISIERQPSVAVIGIGPTDLDWRLARKNRNCTPPATPVRWNPALLYR